MKNVKLANHLSVAEVYKFYARELRLSIVPIRDGKPVISFKEFIERLPTDAELELFVEKYKDADGVGLITGYRGLLAFDIDGEEAKKHFWSKFKQHFGDYPPNITWVEERVDPKTHEKHYHVYIIYADYSNTVPANGTKKLVKFGENGEICIVYNTFIRATPTWHKGSKYQWIHKDEVVEPLKLKKDEFLNFVRSFDPYFELENVVKLEDTEDFVIVEKLDKDLSDEQIDQIIEYITESGRYPAPGQGRGVFILGLVGLLAFLGVKKESCLKLVEKIFEKLDPVKVPSDRSRFIAKVEATYKRIEDREPISYRGWFRALGWTESEIDSFKNEIVKIVKPRPQEFIKKELGYIIDIKSKTEVVPITILSEEGEELIDTITFCNIMYKMVKPSKEGIFWLYTIKEVRISAEDLEKLKKVKENKELNKQLLKKIGNNIYNFEKVEASNGYLTLSTTKPQMERITFDRIQIEKVVFFGDIYVKLKARGYIFEGRIETVVKELVEKGIVSRKLSEYFTQYLAWMSQVVQKERVYTSTGVFMYKNRFEAAIPGEREVYPLDPIAKRIYLNIEQGKEYADIKKYKEFLATIHSYKDFLPKDVYYTVFGFMAIAPFLHVLLPFTGLKPALLIVGGKGSGKTTLARFITKIAYGVEELRQDIFDSAFRQGIVLSSTTLPLLIDDVDKWSGNNIGKLKATLTGTQLMIRGKPSGDIKVYEEKATFVVTANYNIFESLDDPAVHDRLIIVELQRKIDLKEKIEFAKKIRKLVYGCNFGYYLINDLVELANTLGLDRLIEKFEEYRVRSIERNIVEGRDPEKFALLMLGILLLHGVLIKNGLDGFNLQEAEDCIASVFIMQKEIKDVYPKKLVNLAIKLKNILNTEDEERREKLMEHYGIFWKGNNLCVTTRTLAQLRIEQPNLDIPQSLSEVAHLLKDVFTDLRKEKIYKTVKHFGKDYRVVLIPDWVLNKLIGEEAETSEEDTVTDDNDERNDENNVLDEIDKQIIDIANFSCEAVPNTNYQVDLFVKQLKASFTQEELNNVASRIEKLVELGKLQSHFLDAINILKEELSQHKTESKEVGNTNNQPKENDVKSKECKTKEVEEKESKSKEDVKESSEHESEEEIKLEFDENIRFENNDELFEFGIKDIEKQKIDPDW